MDCYAQLTRQQQPQLAPPTLHVVGRLTGPITWFANPDEAALEIATSRIVVSCPFCKGQHVHGWRLDGTWRRSETRRSHCSRGEYRISPSLVARHEYGPSQRLTRPSRARVAI